jgi:tetratricopeptide (TPR) repeat protein
MSPEFSSEGWEWLKERLADYAEAAAPERASILETVRAERPDLAAAFESAIHEFREGPASRLFSLFETAWLARPDEERRNFEPGELISGRYRVKCWLGHGGMGEVYEVADEDLPDRGRIALKTIRGDMMGSREAAVRFEEEVRNSLAVAHRNVCRIYDVGRCRRENSDFLYLTMEYLSGITLAKWLHDRNVRATPLSEAEALHLIRQMAAGLAAIHATGIIHRDFKPANVMLVAERSGHRAVIMDFGLSLTAAGDPEGNITQAGQAFGTIPWMAPEQFSRETPATVTSAADVYALGVTIYELVTGRRYGLGNSLTDIAKVPVSPHLRGIMRRCLMPEPSHRFADGGEVLEALDTEPPLISRHPTRIGVAVALAVVAIFAFSFWRAAGPNRPAAEQQLLQQAFTRISSNSFHDATTALKKAVAIAPHDSFAHAMLAYAFTNLDLTGKAYGEIVKAAADADLERASLDERIFIKAVQSTMAHDYSGAADQFRRYYDSGGRAAKPDRALMLGRALELAEKYDEAERVYESAGKLPAAIELRAIFDSKRMRLPRARQEFDEARSGFRQSGQLAALDETELQLGVALNRWGMISEARSTLESCIRQAKTSGDDYGGLRCKQILSVIARNQARTDRELAATQHYLEGLIDEAGGLGFQLLLGRAELTLGQVFSRRGDYEAADRHYRDAMTLAMSEESLRLEAQVDYVAADTHNRSDRSAEAEQEVRRALAFYDADHSQSDIAWCVIVLGRALRNQGKFEEALSLLETRNAKMTDLSTDDEAVMLQTIGMIYAVEQDHPAALKEYRKALALNPGGDLGPYQLLIAEAQAETGDLAGARHTLRDLALRGDLPGAEQDELQGDLILLDLYEGSPATAARIAPSNEEKQGLVFAAIAKIRTNRIPEGISSCQSVLKSSHDTRVVTAARLCLLEGFVKQKDRVHARDLYGSIGSTWSPPIESAWRADALMCALEPANSQFRSAATAHLENLRRLWSDPVLRQYLSRTDVRQTMSEARLKTQEIRYGSERPRD